MKKSSKYIELIFVFELQRAHFQLFQRRVLIGIFSIFSNLFLVLKFLIFDKIRGFPFNLLAKTASPGPDICIGFEPGIHEHLAELEMSTIRNELSVVFSIDPMNR